MIAQGARPQSPAAPWPRCWLAAAGRLRRRSGFQEAGRPARQRLYAQPRSTTTATAGVAGGEAQRFASGRRHRRRLVDAVSLPAAQRPDRPGAEEQFRSEGGAGGAAVGAREHTLAQRGAFYPSVTAGFSASRQQDQPGALAPVPSNNAFHYNLFTPQLSISYAPDVFGLTPPHRGIAARRRTDAARYQMIATYTTLSQQCGGRPRSRRRRRRRRSTPPSELIDANDQMLEILQVPARQGLCQRRRSCRAGSAARRRPPPPCRR